MCGNLSIAVLATFSILASALGGFVNEPCAPRNTALLNPSRPSFPPKPVQCVDITEMGRNPNDFNPNWPIASATSLFADHMHLTNVSRSMFDAMPNLEFIDFTGNEIKALPLMLGEMLPRLKTLILEKNLIRAPKKRALFRSTTIETLQLSHNKIRRIRWFTFSKMPRLRVLYLDSNRIKHIDGKMFAHLTQLRYLHLGNNQLATMPSKAEMPPLLKTVLIKGNRELESALMCEVEGWC